MFKFLLPSEWKVCKQLLDEINITKNFDERTHYIDLHLLVGSLESKQQQIDNFIKAIKKSELNPVALLKYLIFIHCVLQQSQKIDENKVIELLNFWVGAAQKMVE
jgi:hypothetical protein